MVFSHLLQPRLYIKISLSSLGLDTTDSQGVGSGTGKLILQHRSAPSRLERRHPIAEPPVSGNVLAMADLEGHSASSLTHNDPPNTWDLHGGGSRGGFVDRRGKSADA